MSILEGWIKLHRKITEHEIWADVTTFRLFMFLLLKSTYKNYEHKGLKLKPGQFVRSYAKLAEDLTYYERNARKKVPKSTISNSIKKLVKHGMIAVNETEVGTMFTILNYQYYQGFEGVSNVSSERGSERLTSDNYEIQNVDKNSIFIDVIDYLNERSGTKFRHTSRKTQQLIKARFNEGFDMDDFKRVIDTKVKQWLNDDNMRKYLRPETLFGTKFEAYLNESIQRTSNEKVHQNASYSSFNFDASMGE